MTGPVFLQESEEMSALRKRGQKGEGSQELVTREGADAIQAAMRTTGITKAALAREFGCHPSAIKWALRPGKRSSFYPRLLARFDLLDATAAAAHRHGAALKALNIIAAQGTPAEYQAELTHIIQAAERILKRAQKDMARLRERVPNKAKADPDREPR
jgi:hypothetical protein